MTSVFGLEDVLDASPEEACDAERQRKAGVVPLGLYGIDGLPRHAQPLGQLGLRPLTLGPEDS